MASLKDPLVSIITGFYNRGHLLQRTLDSLLSQTYTDFEVVIFDDCSQDDTHELLGRYRALGDPRLVIIEHDHNIGFTQGMINAIESSRGKYLAIQGSGDVSLPNRIDKQVQAMEERPYVCAVGCFYENVVESSGIVRIRRVVADRVTSRSLLKHNVFSHGEVMLRRDAYKDAGGYRAEFRYSLDYDLWLRMREVGRFFTVKEVLYKRYVQFDGVSYDPAKFLAQARYSLAARQIAQVGGEESNRLLIALRTQGPESLVPDRDPELQRRIWRASVRATIWGDSVSALHLADFAESSWLALLLRGFAKSFNTRVFKTGRRLAHRLLGITTLSSGVRRGDG